MEAGDTFFIHALDDDHLWMIISDPRLDPDCVVVCFLTWKPGMSDAFIVQAGEHPFVKHDTCVNFAGARPVPLEKLTALKRAGKLKPRARLSASLLNRIRKATENSDIPLNCYEILRRQGLTD